MNAPIPSLADAPVKGLGRIQLGNGSINSLLEESVPFLKFAGVGVAFTAIDFALHQLIPLTRGDKTPPGYYGNKLLFSVPVLIVGRLLSDLVGGSQPIRALTLSAMANSALQLRYLFTAPADFNVAVFLIHMVSLYPLSFLITGKGKDVYQEAGTKDSLIQRET